MIFRQRFLDGIRDGAITLAFRRWRRPTVRAGGSLLTAVGQLEIRAVTAIEANEISDKDARRAGYASRAALLADLNAGAEGSIYRIELGALRADPRIALRAAPAASADETRDLLERLKRIDARSADGAWTRRVLELIRQRPAVRAADLCGRVGQERLVFKTNVRKLKALGLTESLEVGYRLSPRGEALLKSWTTR